MSNRKTAVPPKGTATSPIIDNLNGTKKIFQQRQKLRKNGIDRTFVFAAIKLVCWCAGIGTAELACLRVPGVSVAGNVEIDPACKIINQQINEGICSCWDPDISAYAEEGVYYPFNKLGAKWLLVSGYLGGIAGRKLLFSSEDDIELVNNGREISTVSMYWSFWQTKNGVCVATPTLPPAFVTAATHATQKVAPSKSCKWADFIGGLTDSVVAEYKSECPDSTAAAGDLLLNRACSYRYGSRHSSKISGKFTWKAGPLYSMKQVWAEDYPHHCPACTTVGTWH